MVYEFVEGMRTLHKPYLILLLLSAGVLSDSAQGAATSNPHVDAAAAPAAATLRQYCVQCHGKAATAGINLEQMLTPVSVGDHFAQWQKVAAVLEQKRMPPAKMPQPADAQRAATSAWVRASLNDYAQKHAGDPGKVTVRRLTSAEYAYSVRDLTGLDLAFEGDGATDAVGGEGFANFGDVQFMADAGLERYLETARKIADHAVIGSGPIEFFEHPGKTGFELSGITRIQEIYKKFGFRTVSGEGGIPFGQEKYSQALFVAWRFKNRAALGEANATLKDLALREGVMPRFAQHIWTVVNQTGLGYPSSEVAARWKKLPAGAGSEAAARAGCEEIKTFLVNWPGWLFARGDVAAGGAGDESPLIMTEEAIKAETSHHFTFNMFGRGGRGRGPVTGPLTAYLNVNSVDPNAKARPIVIWRNATVGIRSAPGRGAATPATPPLATPGVAVDPAVAARARGQVQNAQPLRTVLTPEAAAKLHFGVSPDGTALGPNDFASDGSVSFEIPLPAGAQGAVLQVDAGIGSDRNAVMRVTFSDRADGPARGITVHAILGDAKSEGYNTFKAGFLQLVKLLPPNSQGEPAPADKDPPPEPFDKTYNTPEHDAFDSRVKYIRDDRFIYENMLDDATRARLDHAWNDLYASFEYHDNYVDLLATKYGLKLPGKGIAELDQATIDKLPPEPRKYIQPLKIQYDAMLKAQREAMPGHVEDCLRFASMAWRRPLTDVEKQKLRAFYAKARSEQKLDHPKAIQVLLARVLVSPEFLYRLERPAEASAARPLTNWELASRLSFFLWSSVPDEELRRAAAAGELSNPAQVDKQVKRMLADAKARRFATEFFGQWLGFYRFDQYRGVDNTRFPEFSQEVKAGMYDEAVSFFEHIVRKDRPVGEMMFADYTFLTKPLAKHYGVAKEIKSTTGAEMVTGANEFHRGGMLRLGAVLTATSAPLRTSPVKRGDWVLRRILGTPTPPPPPDAGSIPADDKLFAGLSVREKLASHKRNATCAGCHTRIDPLGFPLERYDPVGRWRDKYNDGKPVDDTSALADQTPINGVDGLLGYMKTQEPQVLRTLSRKLIGYALGRTVLPSDEPLIEKLIAAGDGAKFSQLALEIVQSKQFRYRREQEAVAPPLRAAAVKTTEAKTKRAGGL